MKQALEDVKAFHELVGQPVLTTPHLPSEERRALRIRLMAEEVDELADAEQDDDIVEIADALADIVYIACGTALEYGIPLDKVWAEVQRSNMSKALPDGSVIKNAAGKVEKPDGWTPPDVEGVLREAGWNG